MAEESSSGLITAVRLALRSEAAQEVEDEQEPALDLLGLPNLDAAPKRANLARAGKGRPPGARNHSTQFWQDFISRRYGSPLEVLAQIMRSPTADLAKELGCARGRHKGCGGTAPPHSADRADRGQRRPRHCRGAGVMSLVPARAHPGRARWLPRDAARCRQRLLWPWRQWRLRHV